MGDATNSPRPTHQDPSADAAPRLGRNETGRNEPPVSPDSGAAALDVAPASTEGRIYRPLSILAIVGLGGAGLYGLILLGGALAAFSNNTPLLLPMWTLVLPFAGGLLSALAWLQIKRAEGTLAGRNAAVWGLILSVILSLSYCAYVAAIFFAVQEQAKAFAQSFFDKVRKGQVNSAFQFLLDPDRRLPENAEFRKNLEVLYNGGAERSLTGALSQFEQNDVVRLLQRSGSDLQIDFMGVGDWEYSQHGYLVKLYYKFTNPEGKYDCALAVRSIGGRRSEVKGAQWLVDWSQSGLRPPHQLTPQGKKIARLVDQASQRTQSWCERIDGGNPEETYLETRLPVERSHLQDAYRWQTVLHGLAGPLLAPNGAGPLPAALHAVSLSHPESARFVYLPGYNDFRAGGFVHADEDFWTPKPELRPLMLSQVKGLFRYRPETAHLPQSFEVEKTLFRPWKKVGDRFQVSSRCRISMPGPRYYIEADLTSDCDAKAMEAGESAAWRFVSLNLKRGRIVVSTPDPKR